MTSGVVRKTQPAAVRGTGPQRFTSIFRFCMLVTDLKSYSKQSKERHAKVFPKTVYNRQFWQRMETKKNEFNKKKFSPVEPQIN